MRRLGRGTSRETASRARTRSAGGRPIWPALRRRRGCRAAETRRVRRTRRGWPRSDRSPRCSRRRSRPARRRSRGGRRAPRRGSRRATGRTHAIPGSPRSTRPRARSRPRRGGVPHASRSADRRCAGEELSALRSVSCSSPVKTWPTSSRSRDGRRRRPAFPSLADSLLRLLVARRELRSDVEALLDDEADRRAPGTPPRSGARRRRSHCVELGSTRSSTRPARSCARRQACPPRGRSA